MKRTLLSILTFGLFGTAEAIDDAAFLTAVAQVEGNSTIHVGANGERSRWQFRGTTWYSYSTRPFYTASLTDAESLNEQYRVARLHLQWLKNHLPRPTVPRLAMAWNAGRGAVMAGDISKATRDYARRVQNLYDEELRSTGVLE